MGIVVTAGWTAPDGTRTGSYRLPVAQSDAEVWPLVARAFKEARQGRGTDVVVLVGDDVGSKTTHRITAA